MSSRPYFIWDVELSDDELRERLRSEDPRVRAQWQARVMAEARFADVWKYLDLEQIVRDWPYIERHLGRMRGFWTFMLDGWRRLGLLAASRLTPCRAESR